MRQALLLDYFNTLPPAGIRQADFQNGGQRLRLALENFKKKVAERYTEGTLLRLLDSPRARTRQAAVLALGMIGTMQHVNKPLALMLRDEDTMVRHLAAESLWSLWFRGNNPQHEPELRRFSALNDCRKAILGLNALILHAPDYAEAYNQRAIRYFRLERYQESVADCERVLQLNPVHFGALAGMGHAYMKLLKPLAALKAFRRAIQSNPNLDGVEEAIQFLEEALGEEGSRDDKK